MLTKTQTAVRVLILHQSPSSHLWEVQQARHLHLLTLVENLASDGNYLQLPVQLPVVFVISVYSQMEASYLSIFVVGVVLVHWNRFLNHNFGKKAASQYS